MAVLKKRRNTHGKTSRQQQLQQQQQLRAKQRFENSRLKPEQTNSIVHDESDTLSYRSYLIMNFVKSAEFMNALMTQPVTNSQIKPPSIFGNVTLESLNARLASQKKELDIIQDKANNYLWSLSNDSQFLKDKIQASETQQGVFSDILEEYLHQFSLRSQDDKAVFHKQKFLDLRADKREAPADYWEKHKQLKKEQRDKALFLQRQKELEEEERVKRRLEEETRQRLEMEENRVRKEMEQKGKAQIDLQLQLQQQFGPDKVKQPELIQQQEQQGQPPLLQVQAKNISDGQLEPSRQQFESRSQTPQQLSPHDPDQDQDQNQPQQQPNATQNGIDSIFGDFGNEPFSSGFDDEFGDLDTAFF